MLTRLKKLGKLTCTTGKKHTFLGMDIEFIDGNRVAVSMPHHVGENIEDFVENLKGNVVNPTTSKLFNITSEAKELYDKK